MNMIIRKNEETINCESYDARARRGGDVAELLAVIQSQIAIVLAEHLEHP